MVLIYPRSTWSPRHDDGDIDVPMLANDVYFHHSVTKHLPANASMNDEILQMRAIEQIGEDRFGYGISYNVVIFPSGRAYQGVSFHRRGTHTGGMNSTVRGICFAGNYVTGKPTAAQVDKAIAIVREGRNRWWRGKAVVYGHRDVKTTACPGGNIYSLLPDFNRLSIGDGRDTPIALAPTKRYNMNLLDFTGVKSGQTKTYLTNKHMDNLQGLLRAAGYKIEIDGVGGPATKTAVGEFQSKAKLNRDYVVGNLTWTALIEW